MEYIDWRKNMVEGRKNIKQIRQANRMQIEIGPNKELKDPKETRTKQREDYQHKKQRDGIERDDFMILDRSTHKYMGMS